MKPDLVITYTIKPNIYGGMVCRFLKIPYAVNITGLGTAFQNDGMLRKMVTFLYKAALRKAKVVFFENEENRDIMTDYHIVKENKNLYVSELGEVIPDEEDSLADTADEITTETDTGIKLLSYADDMTSTYQDELSDETEYKVSFSLPSDFFMYKNKINIVNLMSFDLRFNYGIHTTMDENNERAFTAMYGYESPENLKELSQDKISVLRLPYAKTDEDADQYAMYIISDIMPTENSKVDSFVSSLTKEAFDELLNFNENAGANCSEVSFDVPVVSQTSEFVISGNMDELGLVSPFDDGITGLDGQRLNEIYNATEFTMDVDDSGDGVEEKVSEDQAVIIQNFNVAGPYVYVVKDENTNEIILMGKFLNN